MTDDEDDDDEKGRARSTDPETSQEAAESFRPGTLLHSVYLCLEKHYPKALTPWEVAWELGVSKQSVSPRFVQLEERGLIKRMPKRLAKNDHGNMTKQETWTICEQEPISIDEFPDIKAMLLEDVRAAIHARHGEKRWRIALWKRRDDLEKIELNKKRGRAA